MQQIELYSAGSLRLAFGELLAAFRQAGGCQVNAKFAPAGLLRQEIEAGARPALFASANLSHPEHLRAIGLTADVQPFASNTLALCVRTEQQDQQGLLSERSVVALLCDEHLRVATSTPGCDPSGDYTWQLFERLEALSPGAGRKLAARALTLVGGPTSQLPSGRLAAEWVLGNQLADLYIGYASYARALAAYPQIRMLTLPSELSIRADYGLCLLGQPSPEACELYQFILGPQGQAIIQQHGLMPLSSLDKES
ncbi:molybdate transport system substrate-binding protein [Aeromonas sp. RU39B]|uniref:substrate-binding domain-containing protein n=1 Tax=Aeromonas sp. RU39B TaxID=1907416 RepID=UPI000955524E|nr:substrate-binding domain-containing protein [Aeromonas sp. RU39B]SIQ17130.1 molybdate transport system substrate-binding protein [Aeromonas sp. RU39B]